MVPWLAIDSFTSSIYGSTTSHGSQFTVDVKIDVSGSVQTRSFILNVLECPQSHWLTWTDASICTQCDTDSDLIDTSCQTKESAVKINEMVETADLVGAYTAVGAAAVITVISISSLSTSSSSQLMFSMFGYYQLLSTVLILQYEIPETLKKFLEGMSLFRLDLSFLSTYTASKRPISDIFGEKILQQNDQLAAIGYESGSVVDNYLFYFIGLFLIIGLHLLHNYLYRVLWCTRLDTTKKNLVSGEKLSRGDRLRNNLFKFFHLAVYVSGVLETMLFLYLNCLSELYAFDTSTVLKMESFSITTFIFIALNVIWVFLAYRIMRKDFGNEQNGFFHSLYGGLEVQNKVKRAYYIYFMLRRIALSAILIFVANAQTQLSLYFWVQCFFMIFSLIIRCFSRLSDNINWAISEMTIVIVSGTVFMMPDLSDSNYDRVANEQKGTILYNIIIGGNILFILVVSVLVKLYYSHFPSQLSKNWSLESQKSYS